jgi:acetyl esterase/lipase
MKKRKQRVFHNFCIIFVCIVIDTFLGGCVEKTMAQTYTPSATETTTVASEPDRTGGGTKTQMFTLDNTVADIVNHPAFSGYGTHLLPWNNDRNNMETPIRNIASLMPYHGDVRPEVILDALNYMVDEVYQDKTIFYDIYTAAQKRDDPSKSNTGLFFFHGNPGAPFVLLIPGGGFSYVGSLHEGFPLAVEIVKKGYNAFVIKYRPSRQNITLDTAVALSYIFDHSSSMEVNINDYSLWGLSAGGQAVSDISLRGTAAYGEADLPKPCTGVYLYALQPILSQNDPAAFTAIGESDRIGSVELLENQIKTSQAAGADIEYHLFPNTGHGFGLGTGTNAEGWLDNAVQHWERHMKKL